MHVEVEGGRLWVERAGDGPAVLFIHGATLDHRMWRPQVDALADRHTVITYDTRGHGRSSMPVGPFRHVDDAAALVERLDLERVTVVGHSIGGLYALELALARPDRVAALGLVCMSGLGAPPFPPDVQAMFGAIRAAAKDDLAAAKAIWAAGTWFAPARARPDLTRALDEMLADYSGWYWTHDNPAGNLDPPAETRLEALAMPALVVDGAHDHAYNHEVAALLARRIAGARLVRLPDAGHMANLEDPAAVNAASLVALVAGP